MRFLERDQSDQERYAFFLQREKDLSPKNLLGRIRAIARANFLTAWARITESEIGIPVEPGEIVGEPRDPNSIK